MSDRDEILNLSLDELIRRNANNLNPSLNNNTSEYNGNLFKRKGRYSPYSANRRVSLSDVSSENNFNRRSFLKGRCNSSHSINTETSFDNKSSENNFNRFKRGRSYSPYPINRRSLDDNSSRIRHNQRSFNRERSRSPYYKRNYYFNNSNNRSQQSPRRYSMPSYGRAQSHGSSSFSNEQHRRHCSSCRCQVFGSQGFQNCWRSTRRYSHNSNQRRNFQRAKSCESVASASSFRSFNSNTSRPNFRRNSNYKQRNSCPLNFNIQMDIKKIQEKCLQKKADNSNSNIKVNAHECVTQNVTTGIMLSDRFKALYDPWEEILK